MTASTPGPSQIGLCGTMLPRSVFFSRPYYSLALIYAGVARFFFSLSVSSSTLFSWIANCIPTEHGASWMSSHPIPSSNVPQIQVTRTGRARRPTEKVQAILGGHGANYHRVPSFTDFPQRSTVTPNMRLSTRLVKRQSGARCCPANVSKRARQQRWIR